MVNPSFLGSLFGAFISGLIAIFIMFLTIRYEQKREKAIEIKNNLKEIKYMIFHASMLKKYIRDYISYKSGYEIGANYSSDKINIKEITFVDESPTIKKLREDTDKEIRNIIINFQKINKDNLTIDVYNNYLYMKDLVESKILYVWQEYCHNDNKQLLDLFLDELDELIDELEKHYNSYIKE